MKRLVNGAVAALVPVFCVGVTGFAALAVSSNLAATEETSVDETPEAVAADEAADAEAPLAIPAPADAQPEPAEAATEPEAAAEPQDTPTYKDTLQVEQDEDGNVVGITNYDGDTNYRVPMASVIFSQNGEVVASTTSNADGEFMVSGLELGAYDVAASAEYGSFTYFVEVLQHTPVSADTDEATEDEVLPVSFEPTEAAEAAEPATPLAPGVLQLAVPGPNTVGSDVPGTIVDPLTSDGVPVGGFLPPGAGGGGGYYGGGGGGFIGGGGGGGGVPAGGLGGLSTLLGAGVGVGAASLLDDDDDSPSSPSAP